MPKRTLPTSFTAGRPLNLEGTAYAPGDNIPTGVVARLKRASALLSRRFIIANTDFRGRDAAKAKRTATTLGASERRSLGA